MEEDVVVEDDGSRWKCVYLGFWTIIAAVSETGGEGDEKRDALSEADGAVLDEKEVLVRCDVVEWVGCYSFKNRCFYSGRCVGVSDVLLSRESNDRYCVLHL